MIKSMKDDFRIEEHYTYIELIRVVFFQLFRAKIIRVIIGIVLIAGVLGTLTALLSPTSFKQNILSVTIQFLLPVLFLFAFFTFFIFVGTALMMIIAPALFKPVVVQFNYWGMIRRGKVIYELPWNKIRGYKETKRFIFLFNAENPNLIHTVQKRMFADEYEAQQFVAFVSRRVNS